MSYQESVALAVRRAGETKPGESLKETVERTQGDRPGGTMERTQIVSAQIVSVDTKKNVLKVKGPEGKTREIAVQDPELRERLKGLKAGEVIELAFTEAMAVAIEPSGK